MIKNNPSEYLPGLFAKYTMIIPSDHWPNVLRSYGLQAKRESTRNLTDEQKIKLFKSLIGKDTPIMVRIGNGYLPRGGYSKFKATFIPHWITLWGYNDDEKVFYVYDSCVPLEKHDETIPIGNTKRTYDQILRDIGRGFPWQWRYHYIKIS